MQQLVERDNFWLSYVSPKLFKRPKFFFIYAVLALKFC